MELAAISGSGLVESVVWVIAIGLCAWLLWWLIDFSGLPDPFRKVARVVVAVAAVLLLINVILGLAGHPIVRW